MSNNSARTPKPEEDPQQLSLKLFEVQVETACLTEVAKKYICKSMQRGKDTYERVTPLGRWVAIRLQEEGRRHNRWNVFFRPEAG